jgi:hypothetical protein
LTEGSDFDDNESEYNSSFIIMNNNEDSIQSIEASEVEYMFGDVRGQGNDDLSFDQSATNRKKVRVSKSKTKKKPKPYAQLFFDPETKNLVALMEVNLPTRSTMYPHDGQQKADTCGTLERRNPKKYSSNDDAFYGMTSTTNNPIVEESRFQDQTLLTECSSVS